jgi:isopropylmalate/homocitrate/citramalate synthase
MRLCDATVCEVAAADGERTTDQRVEAGRALDRLGVPFVQAGAPAESDAQMEAVDRLSDELDAAVIAVAEADTTSVERALEADPDIVEVSVPVSDVQLEHVAGQSRDAAYDDAEAALLRAREGGVDVHLTLLDAFRAEVPAIAGAFGRFECPIALADSVGARTPPFVAGFLRTLADASADLTRAGVRFRDAVGCAGANAIVAAEAGVDRVDVSAGGLGGRGGLSATEAVVVATEAGGGDAGVVTEETVPACEDALRALGESLDDRTVLGAGATSHGPGPEADTTLEEPSTFEPFDPERFGGRRRLRFGNATTPRGAELLLERAGAATDEEAVDRLLERLAATGPVGLDAAVDLASDV